MPKGALSHPEVISSPFIFSACSRAGQLMLSQFFIYISSTWSLIAFNSLCFSPSFFSGLGTVSFMIFHLHLFCFISIINLSIVITIAVPPRFDSSRFQCRRAHVLRSLLFYRMTLFGRAHPPFHDSLPPHARTHVHRVLSPLLFGFFSLFNSSPSPSRGCIYLRSLA